MKSLGLDYIAAACVEAKVDAFVQAGEIKHLFHTDSEKAALAYVTSHVMQHGAMPNIETVGIHTGALLVQPKEPASYYLQHLNRRHIELRLREAVKDVTPYMESGPGKDPEKALDHIASAVFELSLQHMDAQILDFRNAREAVLAAFIQQQVHGSVVGIETGWPSLDQMTGGCQTGDLISYVARPGMGKTWSLLYSAHHAWTKQGKVPLVVSLEMPAIQVQQRMAALTAHVPASGVKTGHLTNNEEAKLKATLLDLGKEERPFWLVDGQMSVTIEDLLMMARMIQPDAIYVDGAYMLEHPDPRLNKWAKVGEVAGFLKKQLAMGRGGSGLRFVAAEPREHEAEEGRDARCGEHRRQRRDRPAVLGGAGALRRQDTRGHPHPAGSHPEGPRWRGRPVQAPLGLHGHGLLRGRRGGRDRRAGGRWVISLNPGSYVLGLEIPDYAWADWHAFRCHTGTICQFCGQPIFKKEGAAYHPDLMDNPSPNEHGFPNSAHVHLHCWVMSSGFRINVEPEDLRAFFHRATEHRLLHQAWKFFYDTNHKPDGSPNCQLGVHTFGCDCEDVLWNIPLTFAPLHQFKDLGEQGPLLPYPLAIFAGTEEY